MVYHRLKYDLDNKLQLLLNLIQNNLNHINGLLAEFSLLNRNFQVILMPLCAYYLFQTRKARQFHLGQDL
jgi:hypothetical protein